MSDYTILSRVSHALRSRLWQEFNSQQKRQFQLTDEQSGIVFNSPANVDGNLHRLSLWLYHVEENEFVSNQPNVRFDENQTSSPPLALNLFFLVTPLLSDSPDANLHLLGRTMQIFHDYAHIEMEEGQNFESLHIKLFPTSSQELAKLWDSFTNTPYQLSVVYKVKTVRLSSSSGDQSIPIISQDRNP